MEKRYVLLIDDEQAFRDLVRMNLEISGKFKVTAAQNGKEGIKLAKSQKPDVILLDIRMPKMDGFEVLKVLKEDRDTMAIPVIMLSAIDDDASKIESSRMLSEYYVTKPITAEVLISKIEWVLNLRGEKR